MSGTDIATIIVIVYPVAFIIIYGLSCIAQRELKAEKKAREARELIKEMREEINLTLRDFEKVDEVCRIANVMPFSLTKRKLAELLDKSKEYAE